MVASRRSVGTRLGFPSSKKATQNEEPRHTFDSLPSLLHKQPLSPPPFSIQEQHQPQHLGEHATTFDEYEYKLPRMPIISAPQMKVQVYAPSPNGSPNICAALLQSLEAVAALDRRVSCSSSSGEGGAAGFGSGEGSSTYTMASTACTMTLNDVRQWRSAVESTWSALYYAHPKRARSHSSVTAASSSSNDSSPSSSRGKVKRKPVPIFVEDNCSKNSVILTAPEEEMEQQQHAKHFAYTVPDKFRSALPAQRMHRLDVYAPPEKLHGAEYGLEEEEEEEEAQYAFYLQDSTNDDTATMSDSVFDTPSTPSLKSSSSLQSSPSGGTSSALPSISGSHEQHSLNRKPSGIAFEQQRWQQPINGQSPLPQQQQKPQRENMMDMLDFLAGSPPA